MTDDSPFANFVPSTPETASEPKAPKKKRAKKAAKAVAEPKAAKPEPAKVAKVARKAHKPRAIKIDITLAMSALAGLQDDDQKFVTGVVRAMQPFGKKQRSRIVAALGKIFV